MRWVVISAALIGFLAANAANIARDNEREEYDRNRPSQIGEAAQSIRSGETVEPPAPFRPSLWVRWPWLTGLIAGAAVLVIGSIVVIAVNSDQRNRRPDA